MPFRRLRAAAITGWLVQGAITEEAAARAGNSQAVLEKHYKGVLDARPPLRRQPPAGALVDGVAAAAAGLDDAHLGALLKLAKDEQRARLDREP